MKIAIVSCVFPPEPPVSARTSADLAAALCEGGDEVTVICPFPNRPAGRIHPGFRRTLWKRSVSGGIRIVRCFSTLSRQSTMSSRMAENISFGVTSALALAAIERPDVICLNSWPLFATSLCATVARMRRIPFVVSIQDVYPESLVVQGRIAAEAWLTRILRRIDAFVARAAAGVVVLTPRWAALYRDARGVAADRVHVVPNWIDAKAIELDAGKGREWRRSRQITEDTFLVVYGGNVGEAAGVEELITQFGALTEPGYLLLIAGEGSNVEGCEVLARRLAPGRVTFLRPWKEEETSAVLSAADLLVVPTRGRQSSVSVPSKLIASLLAAKPVLAIAEEDSETAAIVRGAEAGWVISPGGGSGFHDAVRLARLLAPQERIAKGEAGRRYAMEHFGRGKTLEKLVAIVRGGKE